MHNSTSKSTPAKPYPDFPLWWHSSGYWCKKIRGKLHYFGARWGSWKEALEDYGSRRDDLHAGITTTKDDALTLEDACNYFMADREVRLKIGDIQQCTFDDYLQTCKKLMSVLGRRRSVTSLRPIDFNQVMQSLNGSPNTTGNEVNRIKVVLKYLYDADLIDKPIKTGTTFKRPSKRVYRQHRESQPKKLYTAEQIHALLNAAKIQMRGMILLGINCGFGNADCGRLRKSNIDLESGWHHFARPKTGISRRCILWPETIEALDACLKLNQHSPDSELGRLVFVTKYGKPWFKKNGKTNPVSSEFKKLARKVKLPKGLTFYALRHTFETIGGASRDQVAVDLIMGHARNDMASMYREEVGDDRLKAVTDHVHGWLFPSK